MRESIRESWAYFKQPPAIKKITKLIATATQLEDAISTKEANLSNLEKKVAVCAKLLKRYENKLSKNPSDELQRKITELKENYFETDKPYETINQEKAEISALKLDLQKLQDIIALETSTNSQKEEYIPLISSPPA